MSTAIEDVERRLPGLDEPAPDFKAKSTHGEIALSQYTSQGNYVMLFSHPSDFTPVCTTEFVEFARRIKEFEALNVQLLGVSVDSVHAHIAWVRDIEAFAGIDVTFPVVADLDQKVSRLYGMIHRASSSTSTVRAVFAIDPSQKVRVILYYPMQMGRNVDELLRVFQALRVIDNKGVSVPADWQPGERVIVPAPATVEEANRRAEAEPNSSLNVERWYLSMRDI
jgi:peroxiredoxin 2/4